MEAKEITPIEIIRAGWECWKGAEWAVLATK